MQSCARSGQASCYCWLQLRMMSSAVVQLHSSSPFARAGEGGVEPGSRYKLHAGCLACIGCSTSYASRQGCGRARSCRGPT